MENYLITTNTVALLKRKSKTIIYNVDNYQVINKSINKVLEYNCNFYGSSLLGRKKCAQNLLEIKYKVPIIIDEMNDIVLINLNNNRKDNCLYLVTNKIIDYKEKIDKLEISCINKNIFNVNLSKNNLERMIINAIKLNNILKWRKKISND